jgi:hypothetical protein
VGGDWGGRGSPAGLWGGLVRSVRERLAGWWWTRGMGFQCLLGLINTSWVGLLEISFVTNVF